MYLLDTNHCSNLLARHPGLLRRLAHLGGKPVGTCTIVRGELVFMALQSRRVAENLLRVDEFLHGIDVFPVDERAADAYGALKAALFSHFGPREHARRRSLPLERLGFSDNDVWIAAVAQTRGLAVVSADTDFRRMAQVTDLDVEDWLGDEPTE